MNFSTEKVGNEPLNKRLNFGGDPDHRLDTGIVFRIRHYWEIRKVVISKFCSKRIHRDTDRRVVSKFREISPTANR